MRKKVVILFGIITILLLTSCTLGGAGGMISDNYDELTNARIEQILEAIKNKDKKALKSLFSSKALDETIDFDKDIDYLFNLLDGDVINYEQEPGLSTSESRESGKVSKMIRAWYVIETDKNSYTLFFMDYIIDTKNPDNVGLYALRVAENKEEYNQYYWQDLKAGIYNPNK